MVLTMLLSGGCATPSHWQESGTTYQGYEGSKLPQEQVATVDLYYRTTFTVARVLTIDGRTVNKPTEYYCGNNKTLHGVDFSLAELLPGRYELVVASSIRKGGSGYSLVQATLQPGHTYRIYTNPVDHYLSAHSYPAWLGDLTTGEVVAGPTEYSPSESWTGLRRFLEGMVNERATQADVMATIGVPSAFQWSMSLCLNGTLPEEPTLLYNYQGEYKSFNAPVPDNTLVYHTCKSEKSPLIDFSQINRLNFSEYKGCGYLFLRFNLSDELQNYYFIAAPFDECASIPPSWSWSGADRYIEVRTCRYRRKLLAYIDYYAQSGNTAKAYQTLESGIIDAYGNINYITELFKGKDDYPEELRKNVDQISEVLISDGRELINRYPDMLVAAQNSFTVPAFTKSIAEQGNDAVNVERDRLAVYQRLVGASQAENAEHEFSTFFGIKLHK